MVSMAPDYNLISLILISKTNQELIQSIVSNILMDPDRTSSGTARVREDCNRNKA